MLSTFYKAFRKLTAMVISPIYTPIAKCLLSLNGVKFKENLNVKGFLKVHVTRRGNVHIGKNCHINSGNNYNVIGRQQKTTFWVEGELVIGDNVGLSATAIICNHKIIIGNNVKIGGGVCMYDTDFHNLNPIARKNKQLDKQSAAKSPIIIEDNVFIGAHTTILKGVTIGNNSVIGACSVVSKSIPPNEIWAGNPVRLIKKLSFDEQINSI